MLDESALALALEPQAEETKNSNIAIKTWYEPENRPGVLVQGHFNENGEQFGLCIEIFYGAPGYEYF